MIRNKPQAKAKQSQPYTYPKICPEPVTLPPIIYCLCNHPDAATKGAKYNQTENKLQIEAFQKI
jgi:hypothetical protein